MTIVPQKLRVCDDCGEEKPTTQFHGGKAVRCTACSTLLSQQKIKAKTDAHRKKKLADEATKSILNRQKNQKKAAQKSAAKQRRTKERKEATAIGNAVVNAKKFANAERKRLNVAKRELATRTLVKRHLLPFIVRHKADYIPGWVHKDICAKLEKFAKDVQDKKSPRLMIQMPPRHGKFLAHSTPILTTKGWSTHGALSTGDFVFSPSGRPVEILALSEEAESNCVVEFSDGTKIKCHENHEWEIFDRSSGNWKVVETNYFLGRKLVNKDRYNLQVRNTGPLEFSNKELPIDPYFLGIWLGDGKRTDTSICYAPGDCQPIEEIKRRGFAPSTEYTHKDTGVEYIHFAHQGVIQALKKLGCAPDKHIPDLYLQASIDQRLDLLAGLIDSDGHVERKTGRVRIATCDKRLADTIYELATGFGFQPYVVEQQPCLSTSGIQGRKVVYYVGFQPTMDIPTTIPRKRIERLAKQRRKAIISARREPNGEKGRCIQVDSEEGLYLAGKTLIPTHNSEIASVNFPAWYLGNNPNHEIITASYSASLAEEFSKKVRGLVRSDEYKVVFDKTRLDPDNQNASGWRTTKSGGFVPAGVGGGITGKGAHVLIIDDPIKNSEEAESEVTQEKIWDWYSSTAYTRLAPGGGVLIIQTRWADTDLSGRLEQLMNEGKGDSWEIVRYPAIAVVNETYRRKGEALHEARYDLKALDRIRNAVGGPTSWTWNALYQQNPVAEEGGYFVRDAIKWYSGDPPRRLHTYAAWDLAIGKGDRNDFTVGIVVGVDEDDNMWVIDMRRGRWDSFEIVEQIMDVHYEHSPYISGIEKGQIQMAIGPYLEQRIQEERAYDMVVQDLPTGRRDKEARARAIQGRIRQGKVYFPSDKPWIDDLMQEMLRFPHGAHDDCVDALAWIGLMLQDMNHPLEQIYGNAKDKDGWRNKILKTLPGTRKNKRMMTS